jgi:hypothetical protein
MIGGVMSMTTITQESIVKEAPRSATPSRNRGKVTHDDLQALAEASAQELLGISAHEAFALIDRGELEGTLAGDTLRSLRWLIAG